MGWWTAAERLRKFTPFRLELILNNGLDHAGVMAVFDLALNADPDTVCCRACGQPAPPGEKSY